MRCFSSNLKSDLYRVNLVASPSCECGSMNEDAYHFLFECTLYVNHRVVLYNTVMKYPPLTTEKLLSGDPALTYENNVEIILAVQGYIKATKRF